MTRTAPAPAPPCHYSPARHQTLTSKTLSGIKKFLPRNIPLPTPLRPSASALLHPAHSSSTKGVTANRDYRQESQGRGDGMLQDGAPRGPVYSYRWKDIPMHLAESRSNGVTLHLLAIQEA
ncbi:hypothetical protein E2C01_077896 [Portunus trituberculatus]|uniref:Uncharacterized protein n=1 Tax=Portunus trituberculatus TaxID=210409 RepID=A0A5B7ISP1_PORTR|nr:hypothetical protein [Portunus trituberculatus]